MRFDIGDGWIANAKGGRRRVRCRICDRNAEKRSEHSAEPLLVTISAHGVSRALESEFVAASSAPGHSKPPDDVPPPSERMRQDRILGAARCWLFCVRSARRWVRPAVGLRAVCVGCTVQTGRRALCCARTRLLWHCAAHGSPVAGRPKPPQRTPPAQHTTPARRVGMRSGRACTDSAVMGSRSYSRVRCTAEPRAAAPLLSRPQPQHERPTAAQEWRRRRRTQATRRQRTIHWQRTIHSTHAKRCRRQDRRHRRSALWKESKAHTAAAAAIQAHGTGARKNIRRRLQRRR